MIKPILSKTLKLSIILGLASVLVLPFYLFTGKSYADYAVDAFLVPTPSVYPNGITQGPDGNVWFTEGGGNKIGQVLPNGDITEFATPSPGSGPAYITTGPDGNLWFTESNQNKIGRITPAGIISEFTIPTPNSSPNGITVGPDGNLWFTEYNSHRIGVISLGGAITEYNLGSGRFPYEITLGPDNNLWFTEEGVFNGIHAVGKISPNGTVTEYATPTANSHPLGITTGQDGNLWFTEYFIGKIGRITPEGVITEYGLPNSGAFPALITAGSDGKLWFTESSAAKIGSITTDGTLTEYDLSSIDDVPWDIVAGTDSNIWFTLPSQNKIGRLKPTTQVNASPLITLNENTPINEGSTYTTTGSFIDSDSASWTATVDYGDGDGTQPLALSGSSFSLNHLYQDEGSYTVTVNVTDNQGATGVATGSVIVNNIPASVSTITAPSAPIQTNSSITASASFSDPGILDSHTASWNWGDGTTSAGTITESNGSGSINNSHTYTAAGVYTITLTVTDDGGATSSSAYQYVSVYNPTAQGIFSAGQRFTSPAGAYSANPNLTGNVVFGLAYKYQGNVPVGERQFTMQFNAANLSFNATSVSSLVIANNVATLTGTGTINGAGNYSFLVTGIDGGPIRIQITNQTNNTVTYDTQPGAVATAAPITTVTGRVIAHN